MIKMIPIYSFWTDGQPSDEDIVSALERVSDIESIIQINWQMFGYPYCMTVRTGMSIEDCKAQIPQCYGL